MLLYLSLLQCSESPSFLLFKVSGMFRLHSCLGFEEVVGSHVAGSCEEYLWVLRKLYFFSGKNWFSLRKVFELPVLKAWFIYLATR